MFAIIAALPREIAALVKGVHADPAPRAQGIHRYRLPQAVVVAGGMGGERATLTVAAALQQGPVDMLLSVGLAGACSPEVRPGEALEARVVVNTQTGERFDTDAPTAVGTVLATSSTIASVSEKARLAASYDAAMVDMEAATVARLARAHGLRFRAIKGISDAHDFELASLSRFEGKHGSFRTGSFAIHTALRPHHWGKAMTLGKHSTQALAALHDALRKVLASTYPLLYAYCGELCSVSMAEAILVPAKGRT